MGTGVQQWIQELRSHYGSSIDRVKPYFEAAATFRSASERVQVPRHASVLAQECPNCPNDTRRCITSMIYGHIFGRCIVRYRRFPEVSMWRVWSFLASAASCRFRALRGRWWWKSSALRLPSTAKPRRTLEISRRDWPTGRTRHRRSFGDSGKGNLFCAMTWRISGVIFLGKRLEQLPLYNPLPWRNCKKFMISKNMIATASSADLCVTSIGSKQNRLELERCRETIIDTRADHWLDWLVMILSRSMNINEHVQHISTCYYNRIMPDPHRPRCVLIETSKMAFLVPLCGC